MEISEYRNIYEHEKEHFYYVSTHSLIIGLIKKWLGNRRNIRILDAGCGTGLMANKLSVFGNVTGIDFSLEAIKFAKKNDVKAIKGSLVNLPFKDNSFDLITCIDVLVCIKDYIRAINELRRVLKPGGRLILRVSSIKWLNLAHDKFVHSLRRYDKSEFEKNLSRSGLTIVDVFYIHLPILLVAIGRHCYERIIPNLKMESGIKRLPGWLNNLICRILMLEVNMVLKGTRLPIGMGMVSITTKN